MHILTTHSVEGHPVKQYMGLVTGEAMVGASSVIGVDLDYEYLDGMLMVNGSGTAVVV